VMTPLLLARELEGVDLRAGAVARQEVVDGVQDPHRARLS
jgi:hypothetical protein